MATATAIEPPAACRGGGGAGQIFLRILIVVAAAAALLVVALNVNAMAVRSRDPVLLRQAAAFSSVAAAHAAEAELAAGRPGPAMELARSALQQSPLSARALRTFGLAAQEGNNGERAASAMALAGAIGWRDTPTQLWLIDAFAKQGYYASALMGVDALLRRRQRPEEMFATAMAAALDPASRPALIDRLAQQPSWRHGFFLIARKLPPEQYGAFEDFLAAMKASGAAPRPEEVRDYVNGLYHDAGQYRRAAEIWRRYGAAGGAASQGSLFDGHFAQATAEKGARGAFEWRFARQAGIETSLAAPPARQAERALHASSAGNARVSAATQALALEPGRYTLSVDAIAEPGLRLEGFSWIVLCRSGHQAVMREQRSKLPDGWTRIGYSFHVGPECNHQQLKLILHSGQPRPLSLWFDRLRLDGTIEN